MKTCPINERSQALLEAMQKDAPWGALVMFLDTINSITELDELTPILLEAGQGRLVEMWRTYLTRWSNPVLPLGFVEKCPLLAARLDTPQKIRILLRGADFRKVEPLLMGEVFEDIIRRHEVDGEKVVVYQKYRGDKRCDALRIVYHTQLQAWTLTKLALPGKTGAGFSTATGVSIDWRMKEDRVAAGEHW